MKRRDETTWQWIKQQCAEKFYASRGTPHDTLASTFYLSVDQAADLAIDPDFASTVILPKTETLFVGLMAIHFQCFGVMVTLRINQ